MNAPDIALETLVDAQGRLVLLPSVMVQQARAQGLHALTFVVAITEPPTDGAPVDWLTSTEAARLLVEDVDNLSLHAARVRINRACSSGELAHSGEGTKRRIDSRSLKAWRLDQRDKNLAAMDDG